MVRNTMTKIPVFEASFSKMGTQILINIPARLHDIIPTEEERDGKLYEFDIVFAEKKEKSLR